MMISLDILEEYEPETGKDYLVVAVYSQLGTPSNQDLGIRNARLNVD